MTQDETNMLIAISSVNLNFFILVLPPRSLVLLKPGWYIHSIRQLAQPALSRYLYRHHNPASCPSQLNARQLRAGYFPFR
jgi:hypothetical protein